jgi:hypothetical protein
VRISTDNRADRAGRDLVGYRFDALARSPEPLNGEHVCRDGAQLGRAQTVGHRHLPDELEHRLAPSVKTEQVATLAVARLTSGQRMASAAVLREQRSAPSGLATAGGPAASESCRSNQGHESGTAAHPARLRRVERAEDYDTQPTMTYTADPRVDAYIDALPDWQQAICRQVRELVHAADGEVTETIKRTDRPYFVLQGNICALLSAKDHVNVFLYDGAIVPDPEGIITAGHENKTARTVAVRQGETINAAALTAMFKQIVANNRAGGWRKLKREG